MYVGEYDIFNTMREGKINSDFVVEEYKYTNLKHLAGTIMQVSENGKTFIAIVSNWYIIYTYKKYKRFERTRYRIMFHLSDKGLEYFLTNIFEKAI